MSRERANSILEEILGTIEIPDSAYETAERRYRDFGGWIGRRESNCYAFDPHIYVQGSFRLGTVIRPLDEGKPYDLDFSCNLENGVTKTSHTQEALKALVGSEVESYRKARGIQATMTEKTRCWRLEYADQLNFHMDIVPCIPEADDQRRTIQDAMIRAGSADRALARVVADLTVGITDNRRPNYRVLSTDWNVSNPEGYARWFEARMKLAASHFDKRLIEAKAAKIDDLPAFKWKTPLQRCVQILKRHRDIRFAKNPDSKPISIIITTLAARAYQGESDPDLAMERVLGSIGGLINRQSPRVPNPVNPAEDFADKWATPEGRANRLEENFVAWIEQANADFKLITSSTDTDFISAQAMQKLGARLNSTRLKEKVGIAAPAIIVSPKSHQITETPARPWCKK